MLPIGPSRTVWYWNLFYFLSTAFLSGYFYLYPLGGTGLDLLQSVL